MLQVHLKSLPIRLESRIVGVIDDSSLMNEVKRLELIRLAKETSRYASKVTSGIAYHQINVDELLTRTSQHLDIQFNVKEYVDTIRFENFMPELRRCYSQLLRKLDSDKMSPNQLKSVISKALVLAMDNCDVKIQCSCPDFAYRFAYVATIGDYKLGTPETRPAMRTNPENKGSMCKHLSAVVGTVSKWQSKVVRDLYKIVQYDETLLTK